MGSTIPWTGPGFWTGLDSGLDSWIMAQFCTSEARLTSRIALALYKSWILGINANFNFNGVTVRVTCTTKSSKIQLQGGGETCACFLYRSLIPGSPHSQDLGGGGDIQAISLALRDAY